MQIRHLLLGGLVLAALSCGGSVPVEQVTASLNQLLGEKKAAAGVPPDQWDAAQALYKARNATPLWVENGKPNANARSLVDAIASADKEGLRSADYDLAGLSSALRQTYDSGKVTVGKLAALELRLSGLYLEYGSDMLVGRVDPQLINDGFLAKTRRKTADSILLAAASEDKFAGMIGELRPRSRQYQALLDGLADYRAIADSGGWKEIPGGAIKPGERSSRIMLLRARLAATGDLGSAKGDSVYDDELNTAVNHFRARHNLPPGKGVDKATLAALNVPVERRVEQIELNLDRLRWVPNDFGDRYVLVNIPEFQLHAFDGGKEVLTMRVVVGKDYEHATPVFADTISEVVFHPDWNVPKSIATKEIIPQVREDKDYLAEHGYEVVDREHPNVPLDPDDVDWDADTADFHYLIRQGPGERNALGNIKFLFPNRFAVYMHATPATGLFKERDRAASHGCVRLENPEAFARFVLAGNNEWDNARIHEALADTVQESVRVTNQVPVYLLYLTAFPRDGQVQFRDDVYGSDRRALARIKEPAKDSVIEPLRERLNELMRG